MANLNKRSKLDFSGDFDPDDPVNFETDDSEPRPIVGSDSSDGEQISDLEDSDEGLAFINEGICKKY